MEERVDLTGSLENDTIAAIASSTGRAGIGIIRLSGPEAFAITSRIFRPADGKAYHPSMHRKLRYGWILDGDKPLDEVLVSYMEAPHTYTAEDVCEINSHGGYLALSRILKLVLEEGCRLAGPGEFTRRAFLNGRIDLSQAEAVDDIISAKTQAQQDQALYQLSGQLSKNLHGFRERMLTLLSKVEYAINFMEDAQEDYPEEEILSEGWALAEDLQRLLAQGQRGRMIRQGLATAIVGRPNVGKSSLLNALLKEERAIVTDIPGTTRDAIEENYQLDGLLLRLIDTAGIRESQDQVEKIGVDISRKHLEDADLVLLVLDGSQDLQAEDQELLDRVDAKKTILLLNKSDLGLSPRLQASIQAYCQAREGLFAYQISAKQKQGLDLLNQAISDKVFGKEGRQDILQISNIRHITLLEEATKALEEGLDALRKGVSLDAIEVDLRLAYRKLGEITGETIEEDVLNKIFSSFCVGK